MNTVRLRFIDAARGAAMLGVFLAHFGTAYLLTHGMIAESGWAFAFGRIAAPTFVLVSGLLLGYRSFLRPLRFGDHADGLVDRGLFLLTIGHLLLLLAHAPLAGGIRPALRWEFMTDAIGLSLLCGVALVPRVGMAGRLALGAAIYTASWAVLLLWHPTAFGVRLAKETLVGTTRGANLYTDSFPLLPWFGAYLAATAAGEWLARRAAKDGLAAPLAKLRTAGLVALLLALVVRGGEQLVTVVTGSGMPWGLHLLLAPSQKLPPGPAYLLFYGGAGAVLIWAMLALETRRAGAAVVRELAILGRASLALFIAQYFVFFTAFPLLRLPPTPWWPLFLLLAVLLLVGVARVWDGARANRFLTVGYPRLARWYGRRTATETNTKETTARMPQPRTLQRAGPGGTH